MRCFPCGYNFSRLSLLLTIALLGEHFGIDLLLFLLLLLDFQLHSLHLVDDSCRMEEKKEEKKKHWISSTCESNAIMSTMRPGFFLTLSILKFHFKDRLLLKAQGELLSPRQQPINGCLKYQKNQLTLTKNQSQNPSRTLEVLHSEGVYVLWNVTLNTQWWCNDKTHHKITLKHGLRGLFCVQSVTACTLISVTEWTGYFWEAVVVKCFNTPGTR